jgi:glutamate dehydrogenase/leucine dehydrogenase
VNKTALRGARFAVQGYGNAGSNYALIMEEMGAKMVAASDSQGGVYSKNGIDAKKLLDHKEKSGSVTDFPGTESMSNDQLLATECEILCPAALENAITPKVAKKVRAKIIIECANGPTTPEADVILDGNGVFLVPDILANSGGVIVSYLEWVQNLDRLYWSEAEVNARLEQKITSAFGAVHREAKARKVSMRTGALIVGVGRVADAVNTLGLWP